MPIPRNDDPARRGDRFHVRAEPMITGRSATPAEQQRRHRSGYRSPHRGVPDPVWEQPRNGIPWQPYVYRGSGADAFTGEVVL